MGAANGRIKDFFHYETVQIVRIRNVRVSVIHMLAQLAILSYVVVYGLIYKKSYQATGQVVGSADIKVKGVGYTDFNQTLPWDGPNSNSTFHVYDSYDLVMPPMEENALFVTTNMWVTKNQTREVCPSYNSDNRCTKDSDCLPMKYVVNGRQTGLPGSCRVNYTDPQQLWPVPKGGYCDVYAWCPTEYEDGVDPETSTFEIHGVEEFTVFVRMNVHYPSFGITLDNTRGANVTTWGVNLWKLAEMTQGTGWPFAKVQDWGMTVGMNAVWDCDFDKSTDDCAPSIEFVRLDDPSSKLSSGYNFRSIEYMHDELDSRTLTKHYGVRLLVLISGVGARFDVVALFTSIGAGIGLLSIATLIADFVATRMLANRKVYNQAKYKEVEVQEREGEGEEDANGAGGGGAGGVDPQGKVNGTAPDSLHTPLRSNGHGSSGSTLLSGGHSVAVPISSSSYGSAGSSASAVRPSVRLLGTTTRTTASAARSMSSDDEEAPWGVAHYPRNNQ